MEHKIRTIIDNIGYCDSIKTNYPEYYIIFEELFKYHPKNKAEGMIDLKIIKSIYNKPQLKFITNDKEDTISWLDCIKNSKNQSYNKNTYKKDIIKAMRNTIASQIISYKQQFDYNFVCELCKKSGNDSENFHADHIIKFKKISEDFLKLNPEKQTLKWKDGTPFFENKEFEMDWYLFHLRHASLRILCKDCNLKN